MISALGFVRQKILCPQNFLKADVYQRDQRHGFFCHEHAFISCPSCFQHSARNREVAVGIPPENVFGIPPVRHSDCLPVIYSQKFRKEFVTNLLFQNSRGQG